MKRIKRSSFLMSAGALAAALLVGSAVSAQTAVQYKMTTPIAPGVAIPTRWIPPSAP